MTVVLFMRIISLVFLLFASQNSLATLEGINLGSTRVIFDSKNNSASIKVNNLSSHNTWLLRSWISEYNDTQKSKNFVLTPPLYRLSPGESIQLRIENIDPNLPKDKESVFRINVLAIPPESADEENNNGGKIQFAVNNRIKLFYRPHNIITNQTSTMSNNLIIHSDNKRITIKNVSPFHITMADVKVNGIKSNALDDFMVTPFSTLEIPAKNARQLSYTIINDLGGKERINNITF
ncbi:molecular chaperone [Escherichia coli]|uniref:fimbrial biogenesis chaperone n=1 Tax=Escherichia coli TaxID=562 RepID=UPI000BE5B7DC|nr:molecular chaperone [Escherichia coli]EFG8315809.1 molecular chaperone [Escherichia coli]